MSHKASHYAKELREGTNGEPLTIYEKAAVMVLADYHNPHTNVAWPSIPRLAEECLMSERQMYRVLSSLETKGVLGITPRYGVGGVQIGNEYRFLELDDAVSQRRQHRGGRRRSGLTAGQGNEDDCQSGEGVTGGVTTGATQDDWKAPDPLTTQATQDDCAGNQNRHREPVRNRHDEPGELARVRAPEPHPWEGRLIEPQPCPKPRAAPSRYDQVIELIRERSPAVVIGGSRERNETAINGSPAAVDKIAEAYMALMDGRWNDMFVRKLGSLHAVVENLGGYELAVNRNLGPPGRGSRVSARALSELSLGTRV